MQIVYRQVYSVILSILFLSGTDFIATKHSGGQLNLLASTGYAFGSAKWCSTSKFADLLSGYCNLGQTTQTKALVIIQAPTTAHCPCCQGMLVIVLLAFQFIWAIQMPVPGRRRPRSEDSKAQARIILILLRRFIVF